MCVDDDDDDTIACGLVFCHVVVHKGPSNNNNRKRGLVQTGVFAQSLFSPLYCVYSPMLVCVFHYQVTTQDTIMITMSTTAAQPSRHTPLLSIPIHHHDGWGKHSRENTVG